MSINEEFLVPILQNLIKIPTENPPGKTREIVDYLSGLFPSEKGFRTKIIPYKHGEVELHNIVVELGTGIQKIVLCGHLDTVPAGSHTNWKHKPFDGILEDGKIYGRGSADMKGGVVSIIGVLYNFIENKEFLQKYTLVFAGTADEEAGMSGAETLEKTGIMDNAILLIVPEATNLQVGIAEKGVLWIKLIVHGKQAHGSMPEQGLNAIEAAASLYPQLHACLSGATSNILGKSTLNIGSIKAVTKINVVPNQVELELDYRLVPEENHDEVLKKLRALKPIFGTYDIEITHDLPALISKQNQFVKNLTILTGKEQVGLTYGTDAAKLLMNKDIPFVIFGPGDNTIIHQDNEYVHKSQVVQISELLTKALLDTYNNN